MSANDLPEEELDESNWPSTLDVHVRRAPRPPRSNEVSARLQEVEIRVDAATRLADKADATAQEVASAMRDAAPGRNR